LSTVISEISYSIFTLLVHAPFKSKELEIVSMIDSVASGNPNQTRPNGTQSALMEAAKALERTFLSEMLKSAGLGEQKSDFGGGIGEDQFSSFLRDAQASAMVEAGGIGLAEHIFKALQERAK
jgi:Rod binding domain-containing protein